MECERCKFLERMLEKAMDAVIPLAKRERSARVDSPVVKEDGMGAVVSMSDEQFEALVRGGRRFKTNAFRMLPKRMKEIYSAIKQEYLDDGEEWLKSTSGKASPPVPHKERDERIEAAIAKADTKKGKKEASLPVLDISVGAPYSDGYKMHTLTTGETVRGCECLHPGGNGPMFVYPQPGTKWLRFLPLMVFRGTSSDNAEGRAEMAGSNPDGFAFTAKLPEGVEL